jgi:ribosomal protein S18 acetylase RimI-like enzyme
MEFSAGGRLEVRITPSDVGKRVTVRRVVADGAGRPAFTDTVGVLTSWDAGVLSVTRRDGQIVRIPESGLAAAKTVPPAPVRRAARVPAVDAARLQEYAARAWPAIETAPLGGWTLRASGGFTRRANSALAAGDPGVPLPEAAGAVAGWYAARGLPAYVQVWDPAVDAALGELGWVAEAPTVVRTAPLAPLADASPDAGAVALEREPGAGWLARYHRTGALAGPALEALRGGPSVSFATVPGASGTGEAAGDAPVAIGRLVVDGPWAHVAAVEVDPGHRRRGLARAVTAALAGRALREGATAALLQVEAGNAAARALYDRLGFTDHHTYGYRRAPR